ncbi:MAG TPA: metalloregulator ArsR/SmtB family transcription factor [Thermodesulfovibrionales bacterium]|nr:metalloregulator ArsR/SmtB family transcription factor [Thermodesulfovibrionales bacterium]
MKDAAYLFKLLSDETRMRILMLLAHRELCVCQLMGVLGVSQPLISRNLSLLSSEGLLDERREGKLVFYSVRKTTSPMARKILALLKTELKDTARLREDLRSLTDCDEFQIKTGKCDMKTFLSFMQKQRARKR